MSKRNKKDLNCITFTYCDFIIKQLYKFDFD